MRCNHFVGVLVANKIDLEERRVISSTAGEELAQSKGLAYFECSAVCSVCCFFIDSSYITNLTLKSLN